MDTNCYAVRIDELLENSNLVIEILKKYGKFLLSFEISKIEKKPHFHAVIALNRPTEAPLRKALKTKYPKKYAFHLKKITKLQSAISYCAKDNDIHFNDLGLPIVPYDFTQTPKKEEKFNYLRDMVDNYVKRDFPAEEEKESLYKSKLHVMDYVLDYTRSNIKMIDKFILARFMITIYHKHYDIKNDKQLKFQLMETAFPELRVFK